MELTSDQRAAAEACGCSVVPATDDHVWRLTMQRRIFRIDGKPYLVVRDGFNETHATLAALLERHRASQAHRAAQAPVESLPPRVATPDTPPPAAATPESQPREEQPAEQHETAEAPAAEKKTRKPRAKPEARSEAEPPSAPEAEAEPSEAEAMLAEVAATQSDESGARVVGRRRAGQPKTPRWAVAGKARRGRLR